MIDDEHGERGLGFEWGRGCDDQFLSKLLEGRRLPVDGDGVNRQTVEIEAEGGEGYKRHSQDAGRAGYIIGLGVNIQLDCVILNIITSVA